MAAVTAEAKTTGYTFADADVAALQALNPTWQQTMLRVKDPAASVAYYRDNFGMKLVNEYHFGEGKGDFSLYFMASFADGEPEPPAPGTPEAHEFLWNCRKGRCFLELTHNHGTEAADADRPLTDHAGRSQVYHNGNSDPRGFGHIAFNTVDVYKASADLEAKGVAFKKKPNEGRMKGLAFALDPDGYWVEIVRREDNLPWNGLYNLSQTMFRIKDPAKSLPFYSKLFGLTQLSAKDFSDFSLYFFATAPDGGIGDLNSKTLFDPCIELTFNHGTETEQGPSYHNGNDKTYKGQASPRGFGHIGFLVDDLNAYCTLLEKCGVEFIKKPSEGSMRQLAFVKDPDGYWIEVIQRNFALTA